MSNGWYTNDWIGGSERRRPPNKQGITIPAFQFRAGGAGSGATQAGLDDQASATHHRLVPVVSIFFGIIIRMYHDDHPPPHFHASYQGFTAFVGISDGEIVYGSLPKKAARMVRQWALDHQEALMANWIRGEALEPMELIPGADVDD